ncbi:LysR family transcriptional regulator [Clostridium sp. CF012]|nr:LysR family transcriptional regulator [Clostridium sp. CF012]
MNFISVEAFLSIVETKSLSKAAEKLYLSQSTISHRLKILEQELNTELVLRKRGQRVITLTPKGEEFILIAKRWMSLWKDTLVWKAQDSLHKLNIGSVDSLNACVFSSLYNKLIRSDSPMIVKVSSHWTVTIFNLIESHEIDVGFVLWLPQSKNILCKPVFKERMVLISLIESNFPEAVHPKDLNPRNEIFLDCGTSFEKWHDYWWDPSKREYSTVDTAALLMSFLDFPNLWSIVAISIARTFAKIKPIQISELLDSPPDRVCYQITHRYPKPSRVKSLEMFEEHFDNFKKSDTFNSLIK